MQRNILAGPSTPLQHIRPLSLGFRSRRWVSSDAAGPSTPSPPPPPSPTNTAGPRRRRKPLDPSSIAGQDLIGPYVSPPSPQPISRSPSIPLSHAYAHLSPDPHSNLRPIIYASTPRRTRTPNSPYSTTEFPAHPSPLGELEMEWRLRQERVDAINHRFWASMNTQFNAQLALRLSRLPPAADPPTPEEVKRREDVLTQFYADWQAANRVAMNGWVWAWWGEIWAGLRMQTKVYLWRILGRK